MSTINHSDYIQFEVIDVTYMVWDNNKKPL
jgi:hypothetical protein